MKSELAASGWLLRVLEWAKCGRGRRGAEAGPVRIGVVAVCSGRCPSASGYNVGPAGVLGSCLEVCIAPIAIGH